MFAFREIQNGGCWCVEEHNSAGAGRPLHPQECRQSSGLIGRWGAGL